MLPTNEIDHALAWLDQADAAIKDPTNLVKISNGFGYQLVLIDLIRFE